MSGKGKLQGLSRDMRKKVWETPGIDGWWSFLREIAPSGDWKRTATSVQGRCVIAQKQGKTHADSNPSMELVPSKGFAWCFPCGDGESDPLEFLHLVLPGEGKDTLFHKYCQRFGFKVTPELQDQLKFETQFNALKHAFLEVCTNALYKASVDSTIEYAQDAVAYLRKRGVNFNELYHSKLGVFPLRRELWQSLDSELVNLLDEWLPNAFTENMSPDVPDRYGGRIVLPYWHGPRKVGRVKLRDPSTTGKRKDDVWIGHEPATEQGFFGLNAYASPMGHESNANARRVFLVEGEFDQLSFENEQWAKDPHNRWPVAAGSGGAVADVERVADAGYREVCVIPDHDSGGESFVKNLLRGMDQDKLRKLRIFRWPKRYPAGADPDDVIQAGRFDEFLKDVLDMSSYEEPHAWAARLAANEAAALPSPTVKEKMRVAQEFGELLKDPVERDVYIEAVAPALGLKTSLLDKHVIDINDEGRFIDAIVRALRRGMSPLVLKRNSLLCYEHARKDIFTISMKSRRELRHDLENQYLNTTMIKWIDANVGIPSFIAQVTNSRGTYPRGRMQQIDETEKYFDEAMHECVAEASSISNVYSLGQGMHMVHPDDHVYAHLDLEEGEDPRRVYVVNGDNVFLGRRDPETAVAVAEDMRLPLHGAILLEGDRQQRWSDVALTADDLNQVPDFGMRECFERTCEIVREWNFHRDELAVPWLAGLAQFVGVMNIFPTMSFTFLTASTSSGKSTMLLGLFSDKKYPDITLVENSVGFDNWSEAGVLQMMGPTSQLVCLDEFEDPDHETKDRRTAQECDKMLHSIRNMESGMTRIRGTRWQEAVERKVKLPFMAAGIHPFQRAEDVNRWVTIQFDKVDGKAAPDAEIVAKHGAEDIARLRKSITIHAFQNMFRWREAYDAMAQRVLSKELFDYQASRTARMMVPHLLYFEQIGWEGVDEWAPVMLAETEASHVSGAQSTEEALFRAVFHTNGVPLEHMRFKQSVINVLSNPETAGDLSRANVGAYWMEGSDVVVLWPEKLPALIQNHPMFRSSANAHQLYELLKRHPLVHSDAKYFLKHPEILRFLRRYVHAPNAKELLYVKFSDLHFSKDSGKPPTDM